MIAAIGVGLLIGYGVAMWFLFRDRRVWLRRRTAPTQLELEMQRASEAFKEMQRAFAVALLPAMERMVRTINEFLESMSRKDDLD